MERRPRTATTRRITRQLISKIPGFRTISRRLCPPGQIMRKGYTPARKSNTDHRGYNRIVRKHVRATCVKNTSKHAKKQKVEVGPLKQGELSKYGYSLRESEPERRYALGKAMHDYTPLVIYHKLDQLAKIFVKLIPRASKIYKQDGNWIYKSYLSGKKGSAKSTRRRARNTYKDY